MKKGLAVLFIFLGMSCRYARLPLNKKEFSSLLIEMHILDATLDKEARDNKENFSLYKSLFVKYGIVKADFDSCMHYYVADRRMMNEVYDAVIDSLNHKITQCRLVLKELRKNDSLNIFSVGDTLRFDSCYTHLHALNDSLVPGLYSFSVTVKLDSADRGENNRITTYFLSKSGKDTLKLRDISLKRDTFANTYEWTQYIDSVYDRLEVIFPDADKLCELKKRSGSAWDMRLYRKYAGDSRVRTLERELEMRRRTDSLLRINGRK